MSEVLKMYNKEKEKIIAIIVSISAVVLCGIAGIIYGTIYGIQ